MNWWGNHSVEKEGTVQEKESEATGGWMCEQSAGGGLSEQGLSG